MTKTRLEQAQELAALGLTTFILNPGAKSPLNGHSWYVRNTTDPAVVAEWFSEDEDCNYAVYPGRNFVVLDLDRKPKVNGVEAFEKLCAENGIENWQLEIDTMVVKTANGGYHLYFSTDFPVANKTDLPAGIDVRGAIGYVVGPGCKVTPEYEWSTGEYENADPSAKIAPLPKWLIPYLYEPGQKDPRREEPLCEWDLPESIAQAREWLKHQPPAVQGDNGDDHTYWTVCALRDFAVSESEIFRLLNEGGDKSWNARCSPPWADNELEVKIENSFEYANNRPGVKSLAYLKDRIVQCRPTGGWAAQITDAQVRELFRPQTRPDPYITVDGNVVRVAEWEEREGIPDVETAPDDSNPGRGNSGDEPEKRWYGIQDFAALDNVREYLIKGWLIAHGITGIIAKRGTGKSAVSLDIGCHIACDMPWHGMPIQEGWKVIYLCGEDDEGMILNCRAWGERNGGLPSNDRFRILSGMIPLAESSHEKLMADIANMREWANGSRCLVILDTWQRATAGLKSNADDEMELAVVRAEAIARSVSGPMLICYHPPKDGRMTIRGSAIQEDTTSGIWELERVEDGVKLTIGRAKGRGEGNWRKFNLDVVTLPEKDSYGDPLTGIVAIKKAGIEDKDSVAVRVRETMLKEAWAKIVLVAMVHMDGKAYCRSTAEWVAGQVSSNGPQSEEILEIGMRVGIDSWGRDTVEGALKRAFFTEKGTRAVVAHGAGAGGEDISVTLTKQVRGVFTETLIKPKKEGAQDDIP